MTPWNEPPTTGVHVTDAGVPLEVALAVARAAPPTVARWVMAGWIDACEGDPIAIARAAGWVVEEGEEEIRRRYGRGFRHLSEILRGMGYEWRLPEGEER